MQEEPDKEKKKILKTICSNTNNIIKMCGDKMPIENVKGRCQLGWFKDNFIADLLDKDDNIIGVANGLLVLDKKAKFINYSTTYKITRTTNTYYVPYDANNKYIIKVETILSEIISNPKKLKGMLMHISLCLVRGKVDRYFNIFFSNGSSGKTILMQLIENALGMISDSTYGANFGYYDTIDASVFNEDKRDVNGVDHHLKKLEHPRFVQCPEGKGGIIHPHIFKKLRDGCGVRGMQQEVKNISFGGIIAYVTNHPLRFLNYNYALSRRLLYHYFTSKFVPEPKALNEKKENIKYKIKSQKNKNWGAAFLSILIKHWDMMNEEYNGDISKIYSESGLGQETQDYLDSQNYLFQFINRCVKLNVEGARITVLEFCKIYAEWYRKILNMRNITSPETFINEAKEMLDNYILIENKIHYFDKVQIIEENL